MIISNKKYGTFIDNLKIEGKPTPYGVVNEHAVRASAGLMFALGFFTMIYTYLTKDFTLVKIVIPLYWISFFLQVVVHPNWSPFALAGNLFVKWRPAEYVGAVQKRFAWSIGLLMATIMAIIIFAFNIKGILPLATCALCVAFMWLESSLGFCVGCKIYAFSRKKQWIEEGEYAPACAGGVCSLDNRPKS